MITSNDAHLKTTFLSAGRYARECLDSGMTEQQTLLEAVPRMLESLFIRKESASLSEDEIEVAFRYVQLSLRWAESGFAAIDIGHRLAASLAMTSIPEDYLDQICLPWPCFCLNVPDGLMKAPRSNGPSFIWLCDWGEAKTLMLVGDSTTVLNSKPSLRELLHVSKASDTAPHVLHPQSFHSTFDLLKQRTQLSIRLLAGICMELNNVHDVVNRQSHGVSKRKGPPRPYTYKLSRDVKLDVRKAIHDYLSGDVKRMLSVQSLVRGHGKMQACGTARSLRKWIHIEPYWRGPEDAPIAVRAHRMGA